MDVKYMSVDDLVKELQSRCISSCLVLLVSVDGEPNNNTIKHAFNGNILTQAGLITVLTEHHAKLRHNTLKETP